MFEPGDAAWVRGSLVGAALLGLLGQTVLQRTGWWGLGAIVAALVAGGVAILLRFRPEWHWRRVPKTAIGFAATIAASIAWSSYRDVSAPGAALTLASLFVAATIGLTVRWDHIVRAIDVSTRAILLASLATAIFFGPLIVDEPVRGLLPTPDQLGLVAVLATIVLAVRLISYDLSRPVGIAWLAVAVGTGALTRSATTALAALATAVVVAFVAWARHTDQRRRVPIYLAAAGCAVALIAFAGIARDVVFGMFGYRTPPAIDALNRTMFGHGWAGMVPAPLAGAAQSGWLDVWLEVGTLGLVLVVALATATIWRSWFLAVDRPLDEAGHPRRFAVDAVAPLLLVVALVVHSLGAGSALTDGPLMLILVVAWSTKRVRFNAEPLPAELGRATRPGHRGRTADSGPAAMIA